MTDEECMKKYPIRNWVLRIGIIGFVAYLVAAPMLKPTLRDLIPPAQLKQIEQQMHQDQMYQQYQQSELPGMMQPAYDDGGVEGIEGMELDTVKVAQGLNLLFKRDDHLLQRLEALESRMRQMQQPAYPNGMPR